MSKSREIKEVLRGETNFLALAETVSSMIVLLRGDKIIYTNPACSTILGYPDGHFIGRDSWEPFHPDFQKLIRERGRSRQAGSQEPQRYEAKMIHASGRDVWIEFSVDMIELDGKPTVLVTGYDISKRKDVEEALARSEERFRKLYKQTPVMSAAITPEGEIKDISDYWTKVLGYTPEEVLGKSGFDFVDEASGRMLWELREKNIREGRAGEVTLNVPATMIRKDGGTVDVLLTYVPELDDAGQRAGSLCVAIDVTEQKRAQEALRLSEKRLRSVYEQTPVMMCALDAEGNIKDISNHWCETMGYRREEVLEKPGMLFFTEECCSELRGLHEQFYGACHPPDQMINVPGRMRGKDGREIDVLLACVPELDSFGKVCGALTVAVDITDHNRVQKALKESEARYRELVEHAPEAIVVLDGKSSKFVDANSHAARLFGFESGRLIGMTPFDLSPPTQPDGRPSTEKGEEFIRSALAGEIPVFEWIHLNAEGREFPCEIRLSKLPAGDRILVRGTITDVSEQKQLQAHLQHSEKMAAVGMLAAGVAHEIGNPMLAISMAAQSLGRRMKDAYSVKKLDLISSHIDRVTKIVRQMSDLARPQSGERRRCDVNGLIENALEIVRYDKRAKDVEIHPQLAQGLPPVRAAEDQLTQVFMNLALNAFDAMAGTADGKPRQLSVTTHGEGSAVRIVFQDTGPGISPEDASRIFQPFFTTKQVGSGTGLGLAVSYRILEEHGGRIRVEGRPGRGARFIIDLPAEGRP